MNNTAVSPATRTFGPESFRDIYQEYQDFVYRRAYFMLGDDESAEDVTQNTFIQVYRNIHRFRGGTFRIWLFRIATNACYDELRRRQRYARLRPFSLDAQSTEFNHKDNLIAPEPTAEERFEQLELSSAIHDCLKIMPSSQRQPLVLVDMLDMDYTEAAAQMGIPIGTLKSRLWRARAQLRTLLECNTDLFDSPHARKQRSNA
jgi:RNA polymerase sigma-70 factor (ECF subfamily)